MNSRTVSDFFKNDLPSYASYDNVRKIACGVDGLKISMRKILYTLMTKYGREFVKTETLANITTAHTNYLHGAANLGGVCNTMAASYVGSNNWPLLTGNDGGFGTRIDPTPAATRYTRVELSDIARKLFNETDLKFTDLQFFEGDYIEPKFFVPIFPVMFLNGSLGLSTGFSQTVFPRNPAEIISYIKKRISGTEKPRMDLLPWFKGFSGTVRKSPEGVYECIGSIKRNNTTSYTISELPIGMEYSKYVEILDKLCDDKTIVDYEDKCDTKTDRILFEIKTTREFTRKHQTDESLWKVFKLIRNLNENLTSISADYKVVEYKDAKEILNAFIDLRLKTYGRRKDFMLNELREKLITLASKYWFCLGIVNGTIKVSNTPKAEILAQLEQNEKIKTVNGSYDYLLRMPISSLTKELLDELKKEIADRKAEFDRIKATSIEDMWLEDLSDLQKMFK